MKIHLVITVPERRSLEIPCGECGAAAGTSCMRSGGAIVGGSARRFGEYVHQSRIDAWVLSRADK